MWLSTAHELGIVDPDDPVVTEDPLCLALTAWWIAGPPSDGRGPYWRDLRRNNSGLGTLEGTGSVPSWTGGLGKPGVPGSLSFTDTSHRVAAGPTTALFPVNNAATVLVVRRKRDTTNRASSAFGSAGASVAQNVGCHLPYTDGNIYLDFGGNSNGSTRLTVTGLTWDTRWHWWALVVGGGQGMRCYRDGVLIGSNAAAPSRGDNGSNWYPANWGNNVAVADLVDHAETATFHRALSAAEVQAWMESSKAGHPTLLRRWNPKSYLFFGERAVFDPAVFPAVSCPQPDRTPAVGVPY